jgi:hypothetical protein
MDMFSGCAAFARTVKVIICNAFHQKDGSTNGLGDCESKYSFIVINIRSKHGFYSTNTPLTQVLYS